jgi:predicted aspartyl protease
MIVGRVMPPGVPTISLPVGGQPVPAVIDTGFNGDLELPAALARDVHPRFLGRGESLLAAGQTVDEDHFLVDFPFDGQVIEATATFVGSGVILIGTRLLQNYRLEINFVARTVLLERVG